MSVPDSKGGDENFWDRLPAPLYGLQAFFAGLAITALITLACLSVASRLPEHSIALFYQLAVVGSSIAIGMQGGLFAAICSFLAYNFFFLDPKYTFTIYDPRDFVTLLVFFAVAAATASVAGRLREVAENARSRSLSLQSLNALASRLAGAEDSQSVANALAIEAASTAKGQAVVLTAKTNELVIEAQSVNAQPLSTADWQAARRCLRTGQSIFPMSPGWQGPAYEFHAVVINRTTTAVLGVHAPSSARLTNDAVLKVMAEYGASAWSRISLQVEKANVQKEVEAERLRAALLSSISHDIKTPLASIQGSVTSLRELGSNMPEDTKADLLLAIQEEAARLSRFVTNLLDMTRLQSGAPDLLQDWIDLEDAVLASTTRARQLMPTANIRLETSHAPAIVRGNETLVEHVVVNVIENAVRYSQPGSEVLVAISQTPAAYLVKIEDHGVGIAPHDLPRVFDRFFRGAQSGTQGSGLGLTICKEVMAALGGGVLAESPVFDDKGTRITLTFPKASERTEPPGVGL